MTLATYSGTLFKTLAAAETLVAQNVDTEVTPRHLEDAALPQPAAIVEAVRRVIPVGVSP